MKTLLGVLVVLLLGSLAVAGDVPQNWKDYFQRCERNRVQSVQSGVREIQQAKAALGKLRYSKATPEEMKKAKDDIASMNETLGKIRSGKLPGSAEMEYPPTLGAIGTICWKLHVLQVIDSNRVRVAFGSDRQHEIIISGFDTSNVTDNQVIHTSNTLQVADTLRYRTVLGASRTLYVVKPVDFKQLLAYWKQYKSDE